MVTENKPKKGAPLRVDRWPFLTDSIAASGLSMDGISVAIGVSERTLRDYRYGSRAPHEGSFPILAELLNVSEADLRRTAPLKKFRRRSAIC